MTQPDAFAAIADPNRRFILEELRKGPRTVTDLASGMDVTRPAVSQHLKALLDARLVTVTPEGTRRFYAIDTSGFRKLNIWLDQFWSA